MSAQIRASRLGDQAANLKQAFKNPALLLLRRAQQARSLPIMGEETTVLYGSPNVISTQTIYRDGVGDYRCEYHSPSGVNGEVVVIKPDISWHYIPSHHELKTGKGRQNPGQIAVGMLANAIRQGRAVAQVDGQENIAGRSASRVSISSSGSGPSGSVRLWIDQTSGALLRTDVISANNLPISSTFLTQLQINPQFPVDAFSQPLVPSGTNSTQNQPGQTINHIPTDAEAGFHVLTPTYVPQGYTFESAKIFQAIRKPAVSFRYKGNLNSLSIYEGPMVGTGRGNGVPRSPRAGTVLLNQNGMRTVAIGPLSLDDLTQVLKSLR